MLLFESFKINMSIDEQRVSKDLPDLVHSINETNLPDGIFQIVTDRYRSMQVIDTDMYVDEKITVTCNSNLLLDANGEKFELRYVGFAEGKGIILKQEVNFDDDDEHYFLLNNSAFRLLLKHENTFGLALSIVTEF